MLAALLVVLTVTIRAAATELLRARIVGGQAALLPDHQRPSHPRSGRLLPVLVMDTPPSPLATIGLVQPVIVMHRQLPEWLDAAELRCALAHEAAHVARHDALRLLLLPPLAGLATLAVVEPWMAPAAAQWLIAAFIWWAVHQRMSWRAELACDGLAARQGRLETASALIKTARFLGPRAADHGAMALAGRNIARRVRVLLHD